MSRALLEAYRLALTAGGHRVCEDGIRLARMPELEWQARWFAGEFGCEWRSVDGEAIRIEDFGRWNREPGPDFVDAHIQIGSRKVRGAIELDTDARDWEHHGHGINPAFREVVLHVFMDKPSQRFYTRDCDHREITQLHLPAGESDPGQRPPAHAALSCEDSHATAILHAAARHRLDLKARGLRRHATVHGEDAAWFAAMAMALGYKNNQTPFLLLAQRIGLPAAATVSGEALLFGTAGFLESPAPPAADRAVRAYLRALWENWWSVRASCERWILPRTAWRSGGARPVNHPHRRVAALARIAATWRPIRKALAASQRAAFVAALDSIEHPFWTGRFNLQAGRLDKPQALLGAERIRDIVINIYHPVAVERDEDAWPAFLAEKGPAPASIMRDAARRFFGATADGRGFLSSAAVQQGLLQVERDYRASTEPEEFLAALRRIPAHSTAAAS